MEVDLAGFVDGVPERFVPDVMRGELVEAEHRARYWWIGALVEGRRVLDAGCGIGYGSTTLAESGAAEVVGIDIAESVVEAARAREAAGVRFEVGDVRKLRFEDASFDAVVAFEVIEHVAEHEAALDEFARVLRPAGIVAVSSPNRSAYPPGNPHHIRELLPNELQRVLAERFEHVRLFRQADWITSAILDDVSFEERDGAPMPGVELRKIAGREPGSETYTVGIASNAPLRDQRRLVVLTEPVELYRWLEHYNAQQETLHRQADYLSELETLVADRKLILERLTEAERPLAERHELARQAAELGTRVDELEGELAHLGAARLEAERVRQLAEIALADVVNSASWRLTAPLRAAKRLVRGAPEGSERS